MPTYGDESTGYHCHMISVVMFFYSNTLKIILMDNAVTDMGCFDDYLDTDPHAKQLGEMVLLHFFCTFPNVSLSMKQILLQKHLLPRYPWSHFIQG